MVFGDFGFCPENHERIPSSCQDSVKFPFVISEQTLAQK